MKVFRDLNGSVRVAFEAGDGRTVCAVIDVDDWSWDRVKIVEDVARRVVNAIKEIEEIRAARRP